MMVATGLAGRFAQFNEQATTPNCRRFYEPTFWVSFSTSLNQFYISLI